MAVFQFAVLDLEGTLIGDDGHLLAGVSTGLDRLVAVGLRLVLVTGRWAALGSAARIGDI